MSKMHRFVAEPEKTATVERMDALLQGCGITLSAPQLRQLWTYHTLLRDRNSELNLTRVHNFTNMILKLYVDSFFPATMIDFPSPLLDLGTGPGMPGIPLKIFRPNLEVILAESRGNRVLFLNQAIALLGLKGIRVHAGSISARTEIPVEAVITRAVEPIDETLDRIRGSLNQGGMAIFMKGPGCEAEVARATNRFKDAYALFLDKAYALPETLHQRRLVVFRRLDSPVYSVRQSASAQKTLHAISSPQNPIFIDLKKLLTSRGVKKAEKALACGTRQVLEIIQKHPDRCEAWISRGDQTPPPLRAPAQIKWYYLTPDLFDILDAYGTHSPLLVIRVPEIPLWQPEEGFPPGCTVLLPFQDPENVGAAIRSAAAFGASQGILLQESAHPFHPKALRASGGAALTLPLKEGPALETFPPDIPVIALSAEGRDLRKIRFPEAFGLLAGMEGQGLPEGLRDRAVSIPMEQGIDSLNAAVAMAVALYEWSRRRGKA